jgi:dipeptidyl aminopeptidase/acylaminoacyl peptidase
MSPLLPKVVGMKPSDLADLIWVSTPTLAPDGRIAAFVVNRVDADANTYRSQIWLAAVDGSTPPAPFTSGEFSDANPTWAPDGSRLAFTSTRGEKEKERGPKATLHVAPINTGGEVVTVAKSEEPAGELRWSPDGRLLAYTSRTRVEGYDEDDRKQPARRITRLLSRLDNLGFVVDRPRHVYVVPADSSAAPRNLTPGDCEFAGPDWSPDSSTLVVSGATHDRRDLDGISDVLAIEVASGETRSLTATTGVYSQPSISSDGTRVAFMGTDDPTTDPQNEHVAVGGLDRRPHRWVTSAIDRNFAPYPGAQRPHWIDDRTLLVAMEDRGDIHLYRAAADGSAPPEPVWTGQGAVTGYDEAAGTIVLALTTAARPAELFVLESGKARPLTDLTRTFAERTGLIEPERMTVPSADGTVEIDAWILSPPDLDADSTYPMLVNVHGGPFGQYVNGFFDEVQMQAAAGYVVVWCNPRGSSGREEAFGRAIVGPAHGGSGWGSVDYDDVMAVVGHVLENQPFVDPERVGILGGSYGGYMTSWAVGHTDRFAAAVSERAANNLASLEWASDFGGHFHRTFGQTHLDAPELYRAMSPITYVRDITTPLLIIHSENDLRCPVEQADQMFVAMRMLEKEVELVRFPGESHELSRSGSPIHRRQRAEIILDFFAGHLKP